MQHLTHPLTALAPIGSQVRTHLSDSDTFSIVEAPPQGYVFSSATITPQGTVLIKVEKTAEPVDVDLSTQYV